MLEFYNLRKVSTKDSVIFIILGFTRVKKENALHVISLDARRKIEK